MLIRTGKVLGGLAVLENSQHEVARLAYVAPEGIGHGAETELLEQARATMGMLPFDDLEVLVVSEIGKEIGRRRIPT